MYFIVHFVIPLLINASAPTLWNTFTSFFFLHAVKIMMSIANRHTFVFVDFGRISSPRPGITF